MRLPGLLRPREPKELRELQERNPGVLQRAREAINAARDRMDDAQERMDALYDDRLRGRRLGGRDD